MSRAGAALLLAWQVVVAPDALQRRIVIPALANASNVTDLDFQAGECDLSTDGEAMTCVFQQVFLTVSILDPATCLATTNRYERAFQKRPDGGWISRQTPEGACGIVEETILRDEGGGRWTLQSRKTATNRATPSCAALQDSAEILSWENVRRRLPCAFVQPGQMSR